MIEKLTIRLSDDFLVALTLEQARELHRELDEMFGTPKPEYIPAPYPYPHPNTPTYPYITFSTADQWEIRQHRS